jgi:hypothetical protein
MDRLELAVVRAEQAQALNSNPMFDRAFIDTRAAILEAWAGLETSDSERAKDLHRMLKALDRVRKCVQTHIDTGKLAQKEIDGRASRLNPFRRA